ncbi:MAG: ABC transporter ATP-binding protein/permease [Lachnospiraceae bacterium]|nr:ABC transporter ATP-binding protein/permease [Lachnospiraceae bacterium]
MSRYSKYIKKYKVAFILAPIFMLSEVFGEIWLPKLMSLIINNGVANHDIGYILKIGLVMIAAVLLMITGGTLGNYFAAKASVGFSADLREDLYKKVQTFSFANIDDFSTGSLVTRLTNDVQQIALVINMGLKMTLRSPGMMIGGIIMAVSINRSLAVILLVSMPVLIITIALVLKISFPRFQRMQTAVDALNNGVKESLTNVRVIKSFVRDDFEDIKFAEKNDALRQKALDAMNMVIAVMPIMMIIMNLTSVAVVWFGGNQVIDGKMQVGDLTAFITYITQILASLMMFAMIFLQAARSVVSLKRTSEVLDTIPDITETESCDYDRKVMSGSIEFRNVSFIYPKKNERDAETGVAVKREAAGTDGDEVLSDISFKINSGETIGILGSTGCGKTTLVQLIPRLFDVTDGEILVDGKNVKDYSLKNLRDGVSMVLQNNTLFSGTVAENLRWGNEEATDEEVKEAADSAQADGFVSSFKGEYEYMIEQGGSNVSGGQKQRLCIARALLKKPKILILDDSTSAVDTATEGRIREAFATALKDTTKLIIAQRIGSVRDADRIIVMDDGKIVDIGNHKQLMRRCEEYREIYYSQMDADSEAEYAAVQNELKNDKEVSK